jgi:hypothetical protein
MATTPNSIITPQTVGNGIATLTSPTAITTRTNIVGTTGLVQLTATTTNGKKVYEIHTKAKATTTAGSLCVWRYNGTTSFLEYEIAINAVTASTTTPSDTMRVTYDNLALSPTEQLFVSVTVANDLTVFAQASDL